MPLPLRNRTAIVTGASRGIGRDIALKLGAMGAAVVVNFVNEAAMATAVCAEIAASGGQAMPVKADMRRLGDIAAMVDRTIEQFGALNILINNAGVFQYKSIAEITEEEFDDIFAINVKGLFFACQQAALKMADGGAIINISSSVTKAMLPMYGAYAGTKGAVEQITKVLAKELGSRKIAVNAISPGPVDTDLFRQGKTEQQIAQLAKMAAYGRIGTPLDIANAVAFLVSAEAGWITGQNVCVNGGFIA